jgi:serine/threonine protein kinase
VARLRDPFGLLGATIAEKYRIDDVLGEGGYGVVYGGAHLLLDAPIAIKCMKALGSTPELEGRATKLFLHEARVLFELSHPGIVRMFDVGTIEHDEHRVPYVVLERLEGHSLELELSRRAKGGQFGADEIVAIFLPVLEALAFAHAHGVAHRDLKPSNLMLMPRRDGALRVKVLDFGVACWAGEQRQPSGFTGFTPAYAAPEQWDEELDLSGAPSDVFSLSLILAEVCTLSRAFPFTSPARILRAILDPARRFEVRRRGRICRRASTRSSRAAPPSIRRIATWTPRRSSRSSAPSSASTRARRRRGASSRRWCRSRRSRCRPRRRRVAPIR